MWPRRRAPAAPPPPDPPSPGPALARPLIDRWCASQTSYWEHAYVGPRDFTEAVHRMNAETSTVFVFDFDGPQVTLRSKSAVPWTGDKRVEFETGAARAQLYLGLFRALVEGGLRIAAPVLLETHDMALYGDEAPVFCFQKQASSRKMLLPDVDFLSHEGYAVSLSEPAWEHRRPAAVFAGSSTGGGVLSRRDVETARPQRLQWALSALGRPQVDVFVCDAVQCDGEETEALLRAQPYFRPRMSLEAQLAYRYLISIDGNGATCSRVVNALRSGGVLFKSLSLHRLYYFDGLEAFEHYVPINDLNDAEQAIADLESGRLDPVAITAAANRFFDTYLTRPAVERYTRRLLERYAARVLRAA